MKESIKAAIANILIVVLCLGMVGAGMIKLMDVPEVVTVFNNWGFPDWSRYLIGVIEFIIGLCIFIPKIRKYALLSLIVLMVGAFTVHMAYEEFWDTRGPLLVLFATLLLLYLKGDIRLNHPTSR